MLQNSRESGAINIDCVDPLGKLNLDSLGSTHGDNIDTILPNIFLPLRRVYPHQRINHQKERCPILWVVTNDDIL